MWYLIGGSIIFILAVAAIAITVISISKNGKNEIIKERYKKNKTGKH